LAASDRITDIVARLIAAGDETTAFFESLSEDEWNAPVQGEGEQWRVRDLLAHFSAIERTMPALFQGIVSGDENPSAGFDLDRYNNSQVAKLKDAPRDFLLERFRQTRHETVAFARSLADADLDREGIHPFLGSGTLERFTRWAYGHCAIHEDEVRKAIHR